MYIIRPTTTQDIPWIKQVFQSTSEVWQEDLAGFIAEEGGRAVGLITYIEKDTVCEIITLNSLTPGKGIGSMLFGKLEELAKEKGLSKMIVKENDYTKEFFLKKGFIHEGDLLILKV